MFLYQVVSACRICRGGSRIFFRRGCTRLLLYFNTNKPDSFFLQNTSCIRKPQVISGGGAHPLHPPPRSAPDMHGFKSGLQSTLPIARPCKTHHTPYQKLQIVDGSNRGRIVWFVEICILNTLRYKNCILKYLRERLAVSSYITILQSWAKTVLGEVHYFCTFDEYQLIQNFAFQTALAQRS